ncbi:MULTISPECIES: TIGR03826 family flagellar region protein [Cohnella]|jgi:flagellar operon protein (TIGR03826 family)|uniref:TIGR03826 family flagellar region protein n=1 Tax=Cohnella TaxID=329857 RepID=UPI00035FD55D|nr:MULTISPECIES: TIGR03826 family flagellar region protein [Cohnella]REK66473.1 MAG: flagellar protein [Cohnella sp.]
MELANCPRCGKLFARHFRDICPSCVKVIEKEYEACAEYLRKHRGATITELSDATGVTIRQITKFIKEGRISLYNAPNMSYPCEVCGVLIREGNMCDNCRTRLSKQVRLASEGKSSDRQSDHARSESAYQINNWPKDR